MPYEIIRDNEKPERRQQHDCQKLVAPLLNREIRSVAAATDCTSPGGVGWVGREPAVNLPGK